MRLRPGLLIPRQRNNIVLIFFVYIIRLLVYRKCDPRITFARDRARHVRQRKPETRGRGSHAPPPSPPPEDTAVASRVVPGHHAALVLAAARRLVQSGSPQVRIPWVSI